MSISHQLHRAQQAATDLFTVEVGGLGITSRQLTLLQAIAEREGASQTKLVELTGIDRSTLADLVRRLMRRGLVERKRTREDARAYAVKLAAAGAEMLQKAQPIGERVDARLLAALPPERREQFARDLEIIAMLATGSVKNLSTSSL